MFTLFLIYRDLKNFLIHLNGSKNQKKKKKKNKEKKKKKNRF